MVKKVLKGEQIFKKAENATPLDRQCALDLVDTLRFNRKICVGMAANMIGVNKRIIVCSVGVLEVVMFNPKITKTKGKYEAFEGCLSLDGVRKTVRYNEIEVEYDNINFIHKKEVFKGQIAQIIQHEIDHTNGIVI